MRCELTPVLSEKSIRPGFAFQGRIRAAMASSRLSSILALEIAEAGRVGRPRIEIGPRDLIQWMSLENPLWGASRIHGELLMLGFEVAQSTVSKYMPRGRRPPSQNWKTFLFNHASAIAAIDLCIIPTVTFERLVAFLVVGHDRRQRLWIEVTRYPTAEWLARQITEAFPWASAAAYLVRDNDRAYGYVFTAGRARWEFATDRSVRAHPGKMA